jgi:hypothetical protein
MPLPLFPIEDGAPGDGNLVAVYGGTPAGLEVVGGLIQAAQVVETYSGMGPAVPVPTGRRWEPLSGDGVTIWLQGSLLLDLHGEPTVTDFADMLARWDAVRAKLRSPGYELFVYYRAAAPATYRKFKNVSTVILRSFWNNPSCLAYVLGAHTTDKTLYTTAPGL